MCQQRNSNLWFDFLEQASETLPTQVVLSIEDLSEEKSTARLLFPSHSPLTLALGLVDETSIAGGIKSGEPSPPIRRLEACLRELRMDFPNTPLGAKLCPDPYRPRSHAWMLGEYLAERDLLLWGDLTHLHPARAVDWARNLMECGLASARFILELNYPLQAEEVSFLSDTGSWIICRDEKPSSLQRNSYRSTLSQL